MIILQKEKDAEPNISKEHIKSYKFFLAFLAADMRANGLYSSAHMIDITLATLTGPQNSVPYMDNEEN